MESLNDLQGICLKLFESIAKTTSILILPLFLSRIVFSNLMGEGSKVFGAIKGVVIYFCLVTSFPLIIEILFSIPDSYLPKNISLASLTNDSPNWDSASIIPFSLDRILEVILAGLYWIVYYLHTFFMLVMCSMAPIVFLVSTLLGVGLGLEVFIGLLIIGSSWPIIWFGFDQVHASLVSAQTDAFGAKCLEFLLTLFKGISPIAFASLAIKSPAGKAISQTAQASISTGKWMATRMVQVPTQVVNPKGSKVIYQNNDRINSQKNIEGSRSIDGGQKDRLKKAKVQNESPRQRDI